MNDQPEVQPEQAPQPAMGINLAPEGLLLSITAPILNQIVLKWLETNEELARAFVALWISKQQEVQKNLAIMEQIKKTKLH
jgi:hypothetical protein